MSLVQNKPVNRATDNFVKIFLYGQPSIGKTTFASKFPSPIMLNTDGNIKYVDTPAELITNWTGFKKTIDELHSEKHTFKTIVVDLVEDLYTMCRAYALKKMNLPHESDGGWGKGWDTVRLEFWSTFNKLMSLPANYLFLSHEKPIMNEQKVFYEPNFKYKTTLAGKVELTTRMKFDKVTEGEPEKRILTIKPSRIEFSGYKNPVFDKLEEASIPADFNDLVNLLNGKTQNINKNKEEI